MKAKRIRRGIHSPRALPGASLNHLLKNAPSAANAQSRIPNNPYVNSPTIQTNQGIGLQNTSQIQPTHMKQSSILSGSNYYTNTNQRHQTQIQGGRQQVQFPSSNRSQLKGSHFIPQNPITGVQNINNYGIGKSPYRVPTQGSAGAQPTKIGQQNTYQRNDLGGLKSSGVFTPATSSGHQTQRYGFQSNRSNNFGAQATNTNSFRTLNNYNHTQNTGLRQQFSQKQVPSYRNGGNNEIYGQTNINSLGRQPSKNTVQLYQNSSTGLNNYGGRVPVSPTQNFRGQNAHVNRGGGLGGSIANLNGINKSPRSYGIRGGQVNVGGGIYQNHSSQNQLLESRRKSAGRQVGLPQQYGQPINNIQRGGLRRSGHMNYNSPRTITGGTGNNRIYGR